MSTSPIKIFHLSPLPGLKLISLNLIFLCLSVCTQRCEGTKEKWVKGSELALITIRINRDCNLIVSQHTHLLIFYPLKKKNEVKVLLVLLHYLLICVYAALF